MVEIINNISDGTITEKAAVEIIRTILDKGGTLAK